MKFKNTIDYKRSRPLVSHENCVLIQHLLLQARRGGVFFCKKKWTITTVARFHRQDTALTINGETMKSVTLSYISFQPSNS